MRRKNLFYAQLGEAITLAQSEIFEYKRISLILFDNIVENLLISQNSIKLQHSLIMGVIKKSEFEKEISSFIYFDNIIKVAAKLGLINTQEKLIIGCCHNTRNFLYHKLFADKRITDFCILYYCKFLENYFEDFIEVGITGYSKDDIHISSLISKKEGVDDLSIIVSKLKKYNKEQSICPQLILVKILNDYITQIEEFFESNEIENWVDLNKKTRYQYINYYKGKTKYNGLNPSGFVKHIYNIDEKKLANIKQQIDQLKNLRIEDSFQIFNDLILKLEPIYIGIMLYYSEQEYEASCNKE